MARKPTAMNGERMIFRRLLLAVAIGVLGAVFVASTANAAIGIQKWESLTCKENTDLPTALGTPEGGYETTFTDPGQCVESTPEKLFTQAAGHPNYGITDFKINTYPLGSGVAGFPTSFLQRIQVDTPEGLSVNPEAATKCQITQLITLE